MNLFLVRADYFEVGGALSQKTMSAGFGAR
jgi:hypothetical protein